MDKPGRSYLKHILDKDVVNIIPFKRNWKVVCDDEEVWIVKKTSNYAQAAWWLNVDQELRQRGIVHMPKIKSVDRNWILSKFVIPNTIPNKFSYKSPFVDILKAIRYLAAFHLEGYKLPVAPKSTAAFCLFDKISHRLLDFKKAIDMPFDGKLGKMLNLYGKAFYNDGVKTWEAVSALPLYELCVNSRENRAITHRDLASHNWLMDESSNIWLIDFDTADYDSQVGDLWQMTSRILSERGWCEHLFEQILMEYQNIRPLTNTELNLLLTLLSFPNEFYRETLGLLKQKKGYNLEKTIVYLEKLINGRDAWKTQLRKLQEHTLLRGTC